MRSLKKMKHLLHILMVMLLILTAYEAAGISSQNHLVNPLGQEVAAKTKKKKSSKKATKKAAKKKASKKTSSKSSKKETKAKKKSSKKTSGKSTKKETKAKKKSSKKTSGKSAKKETKAKKKAEKKSTETKKKASTIKSNKTSKAVLKKMDAHANRLSSKTKYLIVVDRTHCRTAVYTGKKKNWKRLFVVSCSTGRAGHRTKTGTFKVGPQKRGRTWLFGKAKYFSYGPGRCWYATRFSGHYMLHSVLYTHASSPKKLRDGRLGRHLSHGCVRLKLNVAKWIYDKIPRGTTVHVF